MAQVYVTGPVDLWVQTARQGGPTFLGHGERAPVIQLVPHYVVHHADAAGAAVFERLYAGAIARISVDLVRFNQATLDDIQAAGGAAWDQPGAEADAAFGFDPPGAIGTATMAEGLGHTLYLRFGGALRPTMQGLRNPRARLPRGYRFYNCTLEPQVVRGGSAAPYKVSLAWLATPWFNPDYRNRWGYGSFTLYDDDVAELDGLPLD